MGQVSRALLYSFAPIRYNPGQAVMTTWAVIPVKPLHESKRRLAHLLSAGARAELIHRFLDNLLATLNEAPGIDHVLVVTGDGEATALALARHFGKLDAPHAL